MSIKTKLNRLKKHIHIEEKGTSAAVNESSPDIEIPYKEKWLSFGAKPYYFDGNYCFVREVEYPISYQHGLYQLKEFSKTVCKWNEANISHPLSTKGHNKSDLFFFDTETTGLGGGVGNTIFLLGHARVFEEKVVVKQHFLPNPGAEVALYQSFLEDVDYTTLVTYNGKAFDWPQVKTRHTLVRDLVPKLPEFGHFDLYHAARRLWKDILEQVRLSTVEKEMLGIYRKSDTPGFLAPMLYFDYLKHHNPEGIFGILKHNEIDVLSLVTLYIHLSNIILNPHHFSNKEKYEVARWFEALGQTNAARQGYENVTESTEFFQAKMKLAYMYKKEKEWIKAASLFEEIIQSNETALYIDACVELAKIYEHHQKDYEKALQFAKMAYEKWQNILFKKNSHTKADFMKRIHRLEKKCTSL